MWFFYSSRLWKGASIKSNFRWKVLVVKKPYKADTGNKMLIIEMRSSVLDRVGGSLVVLQVGWTSPVSLISSIIIINIIGIVYEAIWRACRQLIFVMGGQWPLKTGSKNLAEIWRTRQKCGDPCNWRLGQSVQWVLVYPCDRLIYIIGGLPFMGMY